MYIVFEAIASDDPRLDARMKVFGKFWHYQIAYIAPEHEEDVYLKWLPHKVIDEKVAKSDKFCQAVDGEVSLLVKNFGTYEEIISPTSYGNNGYHKQNYFLTETDDRNCTALLQAIATLHVEKHLLPSNPEEYRNKLMLKIRNLKTLNECHEFYYNYFDTQLSAYVVGMEKNAEFKADFTY